MALTVVHKVVLSLTSSALFDIPYEIPENTDWSAVKKEATAQAVFPLIYKKVGSVLPASEKNAWSELYYRYIEKNMRVISEHAEAGNMMERNGIPYVTFKGCASASYYPHPALRTMGDVDFLVAPEKFQMAERILKEAGFSAAEDVGGKHVAFHREPHSLWELHRSISGVLDNERRTVYLDNAISTAVLHRTDFGAFLIPDDFHHGLILLIHTAVHLMSEGIGLRHLCDWAVFVSHFSDETFRETFEEKLKICGLWRFAQILTRTCEKYLGLSAHTWTGEIKDELLRQFIEDILSGGNFGNKDKDRYRQIKYISNRENMSVDNKNVIRQAIHTIRVKASNENKSIFLVLKDYINLVASGKRKPDTGKTMREAGRRKALYSSFRLFEAEE